MFERIQDFLSKRQTRGKYSIAQQGNSQEGTMNISNEKLRIEPPVVQMSVPEMLNVSSVPTAAQNGGRYHVPPPYGPAGKTNPQSEPGGPINTSSVEASLTGSIYPQRPPPYPPAREYVMQGVTIKPLPGDVPPQVGPLSGPFVPPGAGYQSSTLPGQGPVSATFAHPPPPPPPDLGYPYTPPAHTQLEVGADQPRGEAQTMDRLYTNPQQGGGTTSVGNPPQLPVSQFNTGPKKITDVTPGWTTEAVM